MTQAIQSTRPGAIIAYVGVIGSSWMDKRCFSQVGMLGGPAPVRRFLPHLIELVLKRKASVLATA